MEHAAGEDGSGAAISKFWSREEVIKQGDQFAEAIREGLQPFIPLLEAIYGGLEPEPPQPEPAPMPGPPPSKLTLDWLVEQTLWPKDRLVEIIDAIESGSRQLVLAGPPGTSKTWVAQLIARFLTQDRRNAVRTVQFHSSYSYEEFIEGLRPISRNGAISFEPKAGFVLSVVDQMRGNPGRTVIVIDEMNRANLPKVFRRADVLVRVSRPAARLAVLRWIQVAGAATLFDDRPVPNGLESFGERERASTSTARQCDGRRKADSLSRQNVGLAGAGAVRNE